ncbi:hypothetical protein FE257_002804 [Aspergillus nanangensis]|uniref:Transcriptional activator of proteases prtT n=1 Tax=Aspergillus nanangensis TaxID=2582783 RepID=A0AAD4CC72_ASPNN|nr:hypothetical protein FE257_002804 [Aspergillus nanangensis]
MAAGSPIEEKPKCDSSSWGQKTVHLATKPRKATSSKAPNEVSRPKARIRRSMTACHTCRKLKTRCDVDPRGHACRRCLSLRIDCQLPESTERSPENGSMLGDTTTAIPSIEERLYSLERSMKEMTGMLQRLLEHSPVMSNASIPQLAGSVSTDETASVEGSAGPFWSLLPKPAHIIHELQAETLRETTSCYPVESPCMANNPEIGLVDSKLSLKFVQLFVGHFGGCVSIYNPSDVYSGMKQTSSLLYNTACALASRYVQEIPPSTLHSIFLQVRQEVTNILWGRLPLKYETLQALALLCLWPAAAVKNGPPMDSWLLSSISIDHALISFEFLTYPAYERMVDNDTVPHLRLWNTLCLSQVQSAVANARPFHIPQKYLDHCPRLLEHPAATFEDSKIVAEIQLYLITLRLQSNHQRMKIAEVEYEELERWKIDWAHLLAGEGTSSVSVSLDLFFCQILLHRTAMKYQLDTDKLTLEVVYLSRLILSKVLQLPFPTALGFIDHMYIIVGYAALNLCDFNALDPLIGNIQMYLLHLSPHEHHITYRHSCMIADFKQRCADSQSAFGDTRKINNGGGEQMAFVPELVHGGGALAASWEQLLPDVMTQAFSGDLFNHAGVTDTTTTSTTNLGVAVDGDPVIFRSATL